MQDGIMVSVLMLAYNHGKYIRQALDSAFAQQTDFPFEVIVGEDCSPPPDQSREILAEYKEKYGDRLVLIFHEHNVGGTMNALSVAEKARGKYCCSLECDDYWTDPHKLQKQFDFLESHPEYSGCGADHCNIDDDGNVLAASNLHLRKDRTFTLKDYKKRGYTVHFNTIMRYNVLIPREDMRALREKYPTMGDIFGFVFMYTAGPIYVFHDVMLAHRAGTTVASSFSNQQKSKMIYYSYMQMDIVKTLTEYLKGKYDLSFIVVNRIAEVLFAYTFAKRQVNLDKREIKELMRANPVSIRIRARFAFLRRVIARGTGKVLRKLRK